MERIAMSQRERDELEWLRRAKEGSISQREADLPPEISTRDNLESPSMREGFSDEEDEA
jgi:hypothetical protein